jgi:formimidoylglutamate deiminase
MTRRYRFDHLLAESGWLSPGWLAVGGDGMIIDVAGSEPPDGGIEAVSGHAVPGMPNLHSHAFQRAAAGLTEAPTGTADDFWSWRRVMYEFVRRLDPDDVEAIAARLYGEMLEAGYTSVVEFQYLHNAPDGRPYADPADVTKRHVFAARETGIALTLAPVLFMDGGFGGVPAETAQRRYLNTPESLLSILRAVEAELEAGEPIRTALALHSLRSVPPDALLDAVSAYRRETPGGPVHIHVAEQEKEVAECLAWSGARPVRWLLDNASLDAAWCLVHATHMDAGEIAGLAASGAIAGLCPTTEANLGDGIFPLTAFLDADGCIGIGSDSHVSVDPAAELRLLEYTHRLLGRRRNALGTAGRSAAATLFERAARGGAPALGRSCGVLAPGHAADLVVLDADAVDLTGRQGDAVLDTFVLTAARPPVDRVMVGGRWVVVDGKLPARERIAERYRRTLRRILG